MVPVSVEIGAVVVGTISSGSARSRPGGMSSSSEEMT